MPTPAIRYGSTGHPLRGTGAGGKNLFDSASLHVMTARLLVRHTRAQYAYSAQKSTVRELRTAHRTPGRASRSAGIADSIAYSIVDSIADSIADSTVQ
eukprot:3228138-Rhodomonas_salina.1